MYSKPISYSSKKLFFKCPKAWHSRYILGIKEPMGKGAERGVLIHDELDRFFKGTGTLTSKELMPWRRALEALTTKSPTSELEVGRGEFWGATAFDDKLAFFRGKKDLVYEEGTSYVITDWKTGRMYPDHQEQGEDYVALAPERDAYRVEFWYIDQPLNVSTFYYRREDRDIFIKRIMEQVARIRSATEYPATPSGFGCRYCSLSWRNGGKCEAAP